MDKWTLILCFVFGMFVGRLFLGSSIEKAADKISTHQCEAKLMEKNA